MIEVKVNTDKNLVEIISSGFLDVGHMRQIKEELLGAHLTKDKILLVIKEVENIDLSFLQVLHAFLKKLKSEGREFEFQWDIDEEYFRLIERSGFIADFNKISNQ